MICLEQGRCSVRLRGWQRSCDRSVLNDFRVLNLKLLLFLFVQINLVRLVVIREEHSGTPLILSLPSCRRVTVANTSYTAPVESCQHLHYCSYPPTFLPRPTSPVVRRDNPIQAPRYTSRRPQNPGHRHLQILAIVEPRALQRAGNPSTSASNTARPGHSCRYNTLE